MGNDRAPDTADFGMHFLRLSAAAWIEILVIQTDSALPGFYAIFMGFWLSFRQVN